MAYRVFKSKKLLDEKIKKDKERIEYYKCSICKRELHLSNVIKDGDKMKCINFTCTVPLTRLERELNFD